MSVLVLGAAGCSTASGVTDFLFAEPDHDGAGLSLQQDP
jgi:hypothetical protein